MSHKIETDNKVVIKDGRCGNKDASFNHETGEMKGIEQAQHICPCGDKNSYKEQYEKLIVEAEAEKQKFIELATKIADGFPAECSEQDIYDMFPEVTMDEEGYVSMQATIDEEGYLVLT